MERTLILNFYILTLIIAKFGTKLLKTLKMYDSSSFKITISALEYLQLARDSDCFQISSKKVDDVVRLHTIENCIDRNTIFVLEIGEFFEFMSSFDDNGVHANNTRNYVRDENNNFTAINWFSCHDFLIDDDNVVKYRIIHYYSYKLEENVFISECGRLVHYYYEPKSFRLEYEDEKGKVYDVEYFSSLAKANKYLKSLKGRYKVKNTLKNKVFLIDNEETLIKTKYLCS